MNKTLCALTLALLPVTTNAITWQEIQEKMVNVDHYGTVVDPLGHPVQRGPQGTLYEIDDDGNRVNHYPVVMHRRGDQAGLPCDTHYQGQQFLKDYEQFSDEQKEYMRLTGQNIKKDDFNGDGIEDILTLTVTHSTKSCHAKRILPWKEIQVRIDLGGQPESQYKHWELTAGVPELYRINRVDYTISVEGYDFYGDRWKQVIDYSGIKDDF